MLKKSLLLFAKTSVEKGLADPAALCALLNQAEKGLDASWAYLDDLIYAIDNDQVAVYDHRNKHSIDEYDIVYFRYWGAQEGHAIAAARVCKLLNVPFVDDEVLRRGSQNKITQYVNLYEAKVSIPKTLIASGDLLLETHQDYGFDFPFIMKDKGGTRGQSNYLVKSQEEMQQVVADNPEITFILQEFISNNGDYRVLVVGDEVKLIIHRLAVEGSHLNNTSQGGSAVIVPNDTLPAEVLEGCVRASKFYGRNFSGVDIVKSDSKDAYYCFEVNRAPQIEHASFETEKAAILAEYLASF
jgi:glutathione synthase/RimK-type ligase-like ATP-grasp enzyme